MNLAYRLLALLSLLFFASCSSSSFSEDAFHQMLDEVDEIAKECAIYEREVACNKTVNRLTRLVEYMDLNQDEVDEHFKMHPFDREKLNNIQSSGNKISRGY